jgi:hypothetical protein
MIAILNEDAWKECDPERRASPQMPVLGLSAGKNHVFASSDNHRRRASAYAIFVTMKVLNTISREERQRVVGEPRAKGNVFNSTLMFLRKRHPSHFPAIEAAMAPHLAKLPGGKFLTSTWYDLAIFRDLVDAMLLHIPGDYQALAYSWGSDVLERDMKSGAYKAFMRITPPLFLFRIYDKIWSLYHGSGRVVLLTQGDKQATMMLYGLADPAIWLPFWGTVAASVKVLELCGTRDAQYKVLAGGNKGDRFIEWALEWK